MSADKPLDLDYWEHVVNEHDYPLVTEVRRLRAENARLTAEVEKLRSANSYVSNVHRMTTAENARLREALTRIETDTEDTLTMQFAHETLNSTQFDHPEYGAQFVGRDALEGKGT
jgi:predicted nuclease with TOPRIM domain